MSLETNLPIKSVEAQFEDETRRRLAYRARMDQKLEAYWDSQEKISALAHEAVEQYARGYFESVDELKTVYELGLAAISEETIE